MTFPGFLSVKGQQNLISPTLSCMAGVKNTLHVLQKGGLGVKHISQKASEVFREIVCVSMGLVHNMQYKQQ